MKHSRYGAHQSRSETEKNDRPKRAAETGVGLSRTAPFSPLFRGRTLYRISEGKLTGGMFIDKMGNWAPYSLRSKCIIDHEQQNAVCT